jgi:hypothetical protein
MVHTVKLIKQYCTSITTFSIKNVLTEKLQGMMMLMFSTLAISNTVQGDFREYECRIENSYGEDTAKMLLLIEGEFL